MTFTNNEEAVYTFALPKENSYKILNRAKNEEPILSIIITNHNRKELHRVLKSAEKFNNCEIIVVNDGNDKFLEEENILKIAKEKNITLIGKPKNCWVGHSRNVGVYNANGKYILIIDDDDYFNANFVEYINKNISKFKLDFYRTKQIKTTGKILRPSPFGRLNPRWDKWWSGQVSTFIVKRDAWLKNRIFFPPLRTANDRHYKGLIFKKMGKGKHLNIIATTRDVSKPSLVRFNPKRIQDVYDFFEFSKRLNLNMWRTDLHLLIGKVQEFNEFPKEDQKAIVEFIKGEFKNYSNIKAILFAPTFLKIWGPWYKAKNKRRWKKLYKGT